MILLVTCQCGNEMDLLSNYKPKILSLSWDQNQLIFKCNKCNAEYDLPFENYSY